LGNKDNLVNFKKVYAFFHDATKTHRVFTYDDIASAVPDWKVDTVRTYAAKKWREFLPKGKKSFSLDDVSFPYSEAAFLRMMSQVQSKSSNPEKPELPENVEIFVNKARESAVLAVDIYNRTTVSFRSQGFIVMMVIAWTSLLHAIFEQDDIDYHHCEKDGTPKMIGGDPKAWELSECIIHCSELSEPIKANLRFFIELRNKIEHRFAPAFDLSINGECQSMLFNFEALITKRFGSYYSLNNMLSIPLQVINSQSSWQAESQKRLQGKHFQELKAFVETYKNGLSNEIVNDAQYVFRAFLIPKVGNHQKSCDTAIEFIKYDPNHPELYEAIEKSIVATKDTVIPIANLDCLLPKQVCEMVSKRLGKKITIPFHTKAWRFYGVRPKGKAKGAFKKDFCHPDEVHKDYVYTQAWVDFLVRKLSDDSEYRRILAQK
jgi:hypothetical protein